MEADEAKEIYKSLSKDLQLVFGVASQCTKALESKGIEHKVAERTVLTFVDEHRDLLKSGKGVVVALLLQIEFLNK